MTGMPSVQAMGRGWLAVTHPDDRDRVFEEWLAATEAENFQLQLSLCHKHRKSRSRRCDRARHFAQRRWLPWVHRRRAGRYERHDAAERLREAKNAAEAASAPRANLANMSHEIRTPMNGIIA